MGFLLFAGLLATSCGGSTPEIVDTKVTPSSVALSTFESNIQFTVDTTILHLGGTITDVTAQIEGQEIVYDLVKEDDVIGGEEWSITTTMTLWTGFSEGVYYVDITAVSSEGETVTLAHAATVTITS